MNFCHICVLFIGLLTSRNGASSAILYENSTCQNPSGVGTCTKLSQCKIADDRVNQFGAHNLTTCTFVGISEIVCCPLAHSLRLPSITPKQRKCEEACEKYKKNVINSVFPQIAGGQNATSGEFPFMAALGFYSPTKRNYQFKCGGSLISNRYVLTAAHCLWNPDEEEVKFVRLGIFKVPASVEEMDRTFDIKVKSATIHKNYKRRSSESDIALLELEEPVRLRDDLRPACLFTDSNNYPKEYIITGWGAMDTNGRNHSVLQKGFVNFVQFQNCSKRYAKLNRNLPSSHLCAASEESDTCVGDSGGPLLMRNSKIPVAVVVGITSFGEAGCSPGRTSVYTSVAEHLDWIEDIVW